MALENVTWFQILFNLYNEESAQCDSGMLPFRRTSVQKGNLAFKNLACKVCPTMSGHRISRQLHCHLSRTLDFTNEE